MRRGPLTCACSRFLWRLAGDAVRVYKWTGKNDYVALCEPDYLSFGGGCVPASPPFRLRLRIAWFSRTHARAGTGTTACGSTTRSRTARPRAARRSRTSRCARRARARARPSSSSASGSRCGVSAEPRPNGGRFDHVLSIPRWVAASDVGGCGRLLVSLLSLCGWTTPLCLLWIVVRVSLPPLTQPLLPRAYLVSRHIYSFRSANQSPAQCPVTERQGDHVPPRVTRERSGRNGNSNSNTTTFRPTCSYWVKVGLATADLMRAYIGPVASKN